MFDAAVQGNAPPRRGSSAPGDITTGFIADVISLLAAPDLDLRCTFHGTCHGRPTL
jgi:hypothetical protein